jgi:CRISPR/Cas system-associated protein Csm6
MEANQILRCMKIGQLVSEISGTWFGGISNLIEDLEEVVQEMQRRDPTIGDTGPLAPRETRVLLIGEADA